MLTERLARRERPTVGVERVTSERRIITGSPGLPSVRDVIGVLVVADVQQTCPAHLTTMPIHLSPPAPSMNGSVATGTSSITLVNGSSSENESFTFADLVASLEGRDPAQQVRGTQTIRTT